MIAKLFRRLLPVHILMASIAAISGIISGIYGSNFIGADAMSAIGLYAPVNMIFVTISQVLLAGTQILCGKYMGKDQLERTNDIFSMDVAVVTALGVGVGAFLIVFAEPFAHMIGGNSATMPYLVPYLRGTAPGVLPLLMSQQLAAFLSLEREERRNTVGGVLYVVMSAVLGYLFVKILGMGAFGLALASSVSLWAYLACLAVYYFSGKSVIKFIKDSIKMSDLVDVFKVGYAGGLSFGYQVIRGFAFNAIIISRIGDAGLAALSTYSVINNLLWSVPAGILAVGRLLLSVSYGEEDRENLVAVMKQVLLKYTALDAVLSLAVALLSGPITGIYYQDTASEVYAMTRMSLIIVPISMVLSIVCVIFVNWGQITGRQFLVHGLSLIDGVAGTVIFAFIATPILGMNGIWFSYVFNGLMTTLFVVVYAWYRNKKMPVSVSDLMAIPKDFGAAKSDVIDISIHNISEVVSTSEKILAFCEEKGVDKRRAYFSGLAMEEMAVNIVDYGFKMDNKKHSLDLRVVYKDPDVILRIKDDCPPFDPSERSDIVDPEDPTKNIGIRTVYAIAKDVSYQHILGLNVLSVKI